jgi:hypothetical protein
MFNVTVVQNIIDGNGTADAYDATLGALFVGVLLSTRYVRLLSFFIVRQTNTFEFVGSDLCTDIRILPE